MKGDVEVRCNLSKGVYDSAVVDDIKKLMRNKGWDIEECMDVLEIPVEKREEYKADILAEFVSV